MATKKKTKTKVEVLPSHKVKPQPEKERPVVVALNSPPNPALPSSITPERVSQMQEVKSATNIIAKALIVNIATQEHAIEAGRVLQELKIQKKAVETARDYLVKPLKEHVARLEGLFKPTRTALDAAEVGLKAKILTFTTQQAAEVKEQEQKLLAQAQKAQKAGDNDRAVELATMAVSQPKMMKTTHLEGGGYLQTKEVDAFEIEDLGAVPHEYFTVDEKKIRSAISAGVQSIPGVRIFKKAQLAVGTG